MEKELLKVTNEKYMQSRAFWNQMAFCELRIKAYESVPISYLPLMYPIYEVSDILILNTCAKKHIPGGLVILIK